MVNEPWTGCDIGSGGWVRLFASAAVVSGRFEAIAGSGVCFYIVWMLQKVLCKSDAKVATIVGDLPCISARNQACLGCGCRLELLIHSSLVLSFRSAGHIVERQPSQHGVDPIVKGAHEAITRHISDAPAATSKANKASRQSIG